MMATWGMEKRIRRLYDTEAKRLFRIFDDQTKWSSVPMAQRVETAAAWHRKALADALWEVGGRGRRAVGVSPTLEHQFCRDLFRTLGLPELQFEPAAP